MIKFLPLRKLFLGKKYLLIFSIVLVSLLLVGGGVFAWSLSHKQATTTHQDISKTTDDNTSKPSQPEQATTAVNLEVTQDKNQQITSPAGQGAPASQNTSPAPQPGRPAYPNTSVPPNPYCPAPNFDLDITREANSYDFYVTILPAAGDPSSTPACGGVNYNTPVVTHPTNGYICSGLAYPITNTSWGVACSIFGNTPYGTYTFKITATGTNGYGVATTRTVNHTINYQQE